MTFGGTAATNVVVVSRTQITATTPAGTTGAVTVTVTVNGQSGSLVNGFTYATPPTKITYVQGNYATPQVSQASVTVPFMGPQAAGDLNVVVVGWNDSTATMNTVTDSKGNTYTLAVGPTVTGAACAIYLLREEHSRGHGRNKPVTVNLLHRRNHSTPISAFWSTAAPNSPTIRWM